MNPSGPSEDAPTRSAFRAVPRTGVIYVMAEAVRHGYSAHDPSWSNLGQGQPQTDALPGSPERIGRVIIDVDDHEYAPVAGLPALREAVAALYNDRYRRGLGSQYTAENVAICGGGRLGLSRTIAALGAVHLGHFLPDYTAYEELLDVFRGVLPIPILLEGGDSYRFGSQALAREIAGRGLGAVLLSNPANPTGRVIAGEELARWVHTVNRLDAALLIDEFYSHYVWDIGAGASVSAAAYVRDVNDDQVVLFDGLTKNWRYPGWRISWVVGPTRIIDAVTSTGSFLDGGASRPLQRAALALLAPAYADQEARAIQTAFLPKREAMVAALREMGMQIELVPEGTFYVWANVSRLAPPLRDGMNFFRAALAHRVICVPGEFFDVNPGKRRPRASLRYNNHVRFSFGPAMATVQHGLRALRGLVAGT